MVIFDLDGTLWNSSANVAASWNVVIEQELGKPNALTGADILQYMGLTMTEIADLHFGFLPPEQRYDLSHKCEVFENGYITEHGGRLFEGVEENLKKLKDMGVGYVGISLDGCEATHDKFRGKEGAYKLALRGIRNCVATGQKVGLRFTITRYNVQDLNAIFDLLEAENIDRVCFYHLVYSGRGSAMVQNDLNHEESRKAMDLIIDRTLDFKKRGIDKEILTVDNHADAVYLYLRMKREDPARAEKVLELIQRNGGNRSGMAFGNIDSIGNVHPDQFTQYITLGNVRERSFGDIWSDESNPIMAGLKNRKPILKGRCPKCAYLNLCNGNFRTRAEAVTGDFWEQDPACYLTDEEVGL